MRRRDLLLRFVLPSAGPLAVLPLLPAGAAVDGAQRPGPAPRFPTPHGRVEYVIQAPDRRGTGVLTWAEHGRLFRYEATFEAVGPSLTVRRWGYWCVGRGNRLYLHSDDRGPEVVRMALPRARPGASLLALTPAPIPRDAGVLKGREGIARRPCRIIVLPKARLWVHGGLPLRIELDRPGGKRSQMTARSIDLSAQPAGSLFRLPSRLPVVDSRVPELAP